jgi:hypothetical protein
MTSVDRFDEHGVAERAGPLRLSYAGYWLRLLLARSGSPTACAERLLLREEPTSNFRYFRQFITP